MLANLESKFAASHPLKPVRLLYLTKDTLIAVNDSQGLMATYCNKGRRVSIFSIDYIFVYIQFTYVIAMAALYIQF